MSLCQTSCLQCLWKPSPGGLSREDPTRPKRSPRAALCLPLHSSRKRAPGNDRVPRPNIGPRCSLTCVLAPSCSKAFAAECVQEFLGKLGGMGQEAKVSAREIDNIAPPLPCQDPVWLVGQLLVGVASCGRDDPL